MNVVSFYRFLDLAEPEALAAGLRAECGRRGVLGTVLVAAEGVNGTIAGAAADLRGVLTWIECVLALATPLEGRWTQAAEAPFRRLRVCVKREIVALGRPDLRPQQHTGRHVPPAEWNALLDDAGVVVIDARNRYEVEVGSFPGALDPGTDNFRQFPGFAHRLADTARVRRIAMFCTGGIRCEKAAVLMRELGFDEVYQLEGGILRYLEEMPGECNRWQGECFVFDTRVAVDRDLAEGEYVQCHACRRPLSSSDLASRDYAEGISCPHCIGTLTPERAARLEERRKQVALAAGRGEKHIGPK
jgi:UPF0176 protein